LTRSGNFYTVKIWCSEVARKSKLVLLQQKQKGSVMTPSTTIPELASALRASCSFGTRCSCAASIEARAASGESAEAILQEYGADGGFMRLTIIDITALMMAVPTQRQMAFKIERFRVLLKAADRNKSGHMALLSLMSMEIRRDLETMSNAGTPFDAGVILAKDPTFDMGAFLQSFMGNNPPETTGDAMPQPTADREPALAD